MTPRARLVIFLVVAQILSACYPSGHEDEVLPEVADEHKDFSIITGIPCEPPCWHGLEVCESTFLEVREVLINLEFLDKEDIKRSDLNYNDECGINDGKKESYLIDFKCIEPKGRSCAMFQFGGDLLQRIMLFPNYNITLSDIVNAMGPPALIAAFPTGIECPGCGISLEYPDRQISFNHSTSECDAWEDRCQPVYDGLPINPDLRVTSIIIVPAGQINQSPEQGNEFPWPGFYSSQE